MKKAVCGLLILILTMALSACGNQPYPELPENPIRFELGAYSTKKNNGSGYRTIEYQGRTYIPYGTVGKPMSVKDIDTCLGYTIRDGQELVDTRVYTLMSDHEHNFLMQFNATGIMEEPYFFRATDTQGKDIFIPKFIDSFRYSYWK